MKHSIQMSFIAASLFGSVGLTASPKQQVVITSKANASSSANKVELNVVFDYKGATNLSLTDSKNPNKLVFDHVEQVLQTYGTILPGLETGVNRHSVRILVDSVRSGVSVASEPQLVSQIRKIDSAFRPYWSDYSELSTEELVQQQKDGLYLKLNYAASHELSRFLFCTVMDYKANVAGTIKLPPFVQARMKADCTALDADTERLEKATSLADSKVYRLEAGDFIFDYPDYWSPAKFFKELDLCDNIGDFEALTAAGWIKGIRSDITSKQDECRNFVSEKVLSHIDEAMTLGIQSDVLKKEINPFYRGLVHDLLTKSGAKYQLTPVDLERDVAKILKNSFALEKGFSSNELQTSFFNTEAFLKAMQKPVEDPMSLIALLLSTPEMRTVELRKELANMPEDAQLAYTEGLVKALGKVCQSSTFTPSCLYAGATRIDSQVARVTLQSGLGATPVWAGYMLLPVSEKKAEL